MATFFDTFGVYLTMLSHWMMLGGDPPPPPHLNSPIGLYCVSGIKWETNEIKMFRRVRQNTS